MRRVPIALVMAILITAVAVIPAAAATCGRMTGLARLQVDDATNTGVGTAVVVFAGLIQVADFTTSAEPGGPGGTLLVTHTWNLDQGSITMLEVNDSLVPIPGTSLLVFTSTAGVFAGGSGSLALTGLYDDAADVARFAFRGSVCVG